MNKPWTEVQITWFSVYPIQIKYLFCVLNPNWKQINLVSSFTSTIYKQMSDSNFFFILLLMGICIDFGEIRKKYTELVSRQFCKYMYDFHKTKPKRSLFFNEETFQNLILKISS